MAAHIHTAMKEDMCPTINRNPTEAKSENGQRGTEKDDVHVMRISGSDGTSTAAENAYKIRAYK